MTFDEWYKNNAEYTPEPGYGFVGWTDEKLNEAFNAGRLAGLEEAAELVEKYAEWKLVNAIRERIKETNND